MCGIVGFTGEHQAAPILLDGLSKLEYRGTTRQELLYVTAVQMQRLLRQKAD